MKRNLSKVQIQILSLLAYRGNWVSMAGTSPHAMADFIAPLVERRNPLKVSGANEFRITSHGEDILSQWLSRHLSKVEAV